MTAIDPVAAHYARSSDEELIGLLAQGENSFTPEAWTALQREIARRQLPMSIPENSSVESPDEPIAKRLLARAKSVAEGLRSLPAPQDSAQTRQPVKSGEQSAARTGTGGWLAVFQAVIVLNASAFIVGFLSADGTPSIGGLLLLGVFTVMPLVGLVLIAQRRRSAPKYWIAYLGFGAIAAAVAWAMGLAAGGRTAWRIFLAAVWMIYWAKSKRVRATFRDSRDGRVRGPG